MPGATSTRCNARWKKSKPIAPPRFHLPFLEGLIELGSATRSLVVDPPEEFEPGPLAATDITAETDDRARHLALSEAWRAQGKPFESEALHGRAGEI